MAEFETYKTPEEKAAHVAAQFGTDSLYAKVWNVIADIAAETNLKTGVKAGELFASFKINQKNNQKAIAKKREIEAKNQS